MEDNIREEGGEDGKIYLLFFGKIKKSEINRVQLFVCDLDFGECYCKSSYIREGFRRKFWSGLKYLKGKFKKIFIIFCFFFEVCEYDKEYGEDEEEEGEGI